MSNMSYCRFQNTLHDLKDCEAHLVDKLSDEEKIARRRLILLCIQVLEGVDIEVEPSTKEITDRLDQLDVESDDNEEFEDEDE